MKIAAAIFAFIITSLTIQPILSNQEQVGNSQCCSTEKCHKAEKKDKPRQCENNGCNPFMACTFGNFFFNEQEFVLSTRDNLPRQKMIVVNDNRISGKLSDFWHPPEMS